MTERLSTGSVFADRSVFRCRSYYYLCVMRPTGQERTALEKRVCCSFPRGGTHNAMGGYAGKRRGPEEAGRERRKSGQGPLLWFSQEGMGEAG